MTHPSAVLDHGRFQHISAASLSPCPQWHQELDPSQSPRTCSPVFKLQLLLMDLRPGQTVEVVLGDSSSTAQCPGEVEPSLSDPHHWGFFCSPLDIFLRKGASDFKKLF